MSVVPPCPPPALNIVSDRQTFNEAAQGSHLPLGSMCKYLMKMRRSHSWIKVPEWQAQEVLELHKLIDSSNPVMWNSDTGVFRQITGSNPTDLKLWLAKYAEGFQ